MVDRYDIAWHEKTLGQLFCDGSARQIVAMLLEECAKGSVELLLGREIRQVSHGDGRFQVKCADRLASAPALVIATRSEEHTSELQSLMSISYAVFCLKKK